MVAKNPKWHKAYGDAWDRIEQVIRKHGKEIERRQYQTLRWSKLTGLAINIVKYAQEVTKPDGERLDGFHDYEVIELLLSKLLLLLYWAKSNDKRSKALALLQANSLHRYPNRMRNLKRR